MPAPPPQLPPHLPPQSPPSALPWTPFLGLRCWRAIFSLLMGIVAASCIGPASTTRQPPATVGVADAQGRVLADFEKPDAGTLIWKPLVSLTPSTTSTTEPATQAAATEPAPAVFSRSSLRPQGGLWSEKISLGGGGEGQTMAARDGGTLTMPFAGMSGFDLSGYGLVALQVMHLGPAARNGQCLAAIVLTDTSGKSVEGDLFSVTTQWEEVPLDLQWALDQGLDLSRVASMGVVLRPSGAAGALVPAASDNGADGDGLDIQTDTWTAEKRERFYVGSRDTPVQVVREGEFSTPHVPPKPFFVEARGARLMVGTVDQYEITFWNRGGSRADDSQPSGASSPDGSAAPAQRPWLEVRAGSPGKTVIGQPGSGLTLLDQENLDKIGAGVRRDSDDAPSAVSTNAISSATWPLKPDPHSPSGATASRWHWEVVWTSPLAALVEVKQEAGPYDRLGEPAALLTWRFMIYQWGEVFVHVDLTKSGEAAPADPISWALAMDNEVMDRSASASGVQGADAERLLSEIYPAGVREGLETALPHRMQTGAPVAIIGKTSASASGGGGLAKNAWWWALEKSAAGGQAGDSVMKLAGVGLGAAGPALTRHHADCMLLANTPNALMKAGAFAQYLVPPKVIVSQGELDRNFPGDADNDGFVESYGFQAIRLANGRAAFTIYPQQRPIFYPVYLFTIPAIEREALDLAHSRILINIDGKQFADPPQFPDGSFLLQFPYVLDRPVSVEAVLVKR